ncbi:hypothetical protein Asp14428_70530 [Actinoplanes sp. NBRC 14428]|uniref:Methyl-accepting chemotaxis protein n=1 Tax=Pseudosporangium ferrugineum TaxID=439699 RepID=A0A2T0S2M3_9ACTN|nr:methyl-accepting chemotaxis protein [Pseudosporangium ferrugineum]PRY27652.1 methyl-accepting chemotaxis protein [Pseudosporangium ferrugineum]BCJ55578.1 hypothetical protein Asp14428_70530 [Actinoplanes sp. NBRC 14428]
MVPEKSAKPARGGLLANRPVRVKILAIVALLAVVTVAVGAIGLNRLHVMNDRLQVMREQNLERMVELSDTRAGLMEMYYYLIGSAALSDRVKPDSPEYKQGVAKYQEIVKGIDGRIDASLAGYRAKGGSTAEREAGVARAQEALAAYRNFRDVFFFGAAPPAGFVMPTDEPGIVALNTNLTESIDALSAQERSAAAAAADSGASTYRAAYVSIAVVLAVGLLLAIAFALLVARLIVRPLTELTRSAEAMAAGDLTVDVPVTGRDEVGRMAAALGRARVGIRQVVGSVGAASQSLADAAQRTTAISARMSEGAVAASAQAQDVAAASEQVSTGVNTVAAGTEEMGASIGEIAQSANAAAEVAGQAVSVAQSTNRTIATLGESSRQIGDVIKVITSIAEQTNLLALNATIEAARAGEAGKGFAVVASEVKDLAQETARATEDISRRVEAIQSDSGSAVEAISEIAGVIERINEYTTTIASAVEEQAATTAEMNRNVSEAAAATNRISTSIEGVATTARGTAESVEEAKESAAALARMSGELQESISNFRY